MVALLAEEDCCTEAAYACAHDGDAEGFGAYGTVRDVATGVNTVLFREIHCSIGTSK